MGRTRGGLNIALSGYYTIASSGLYNISNFQNVSYGEVWYSLATQFRNNGFLPSVHICNAAGFWETMNKVDLLERIKRIKAQGDDPKVEQAALESVIW